MSANDHTQLGATLTHARDLLTGDRAASYGDPEDTYRYAAQIASAMLRRDVTADDVLVVMLAVKLAREGGKHGADNLVDATAFADALNRHRELAQEKDVNRRVLFTCQPPIVDSMTPRCVQCDCLLPTPADAYSMPRASGEPYYCRSCYERLDENRKEVTPC